MTTPDRVIIAGQGFPHSDTLAWARRAEGHWADYCNAPGYEWTKAALDTGAYGAREPSRT